MDVSVFQFFLFRHVALLEIETFLRHPEVDLFCTRQGWFHLPSALFINTNAHQQIMLKSSF
jgi:hypothetical protein